MSTISGIDVKKELTELKPKGGEEIAVLSGFTRVCFSLLKRDSGINLWLDCQNECVREYIVSLMKERFGVEPISPTGAIYTKISGSELVYADAEKLLKALCIQKSGDVFAFEGIDSRFYKKAGAYARGVFLGCGSLSLPTADDVETKKSGGYHLEFAFSGEELANEFINLLTKFNIYGHLTVRGEKYIVYIKDSQDVSDCLALMGADRTVLKLNEAVAVFSVKRDVVRRLNCEVANMDRTLEASFGITEAINLISEKAGLDVLDDKLKAAAKARLDYPQAPIGKLAEILGISKSGLKHRFDRIAEFSKSYRTDGEEGQ